MRTVTRCWVLAALLVAGCESDSPDSPAAADSGSDASPATRGGAADVPTMPMPDASREGVPLDAQLTVLPLLVADSAFEPRMLEVLEPEELCEELPAEDDCTDNTAPVLSPAVYVINGEEFPDLSDVRNGDEVTVLVAIEDAECNVACGTNFSSHESSTSSGTAAGSLPSNVPCDTEATGIHLGLFVGLATVSGAGVEDRPDEPYSFRLGLSDRCGARSEPLELRFVVKY